MWTEHELPIKGLTLFVGDHVDGMIPVWMPHVRDKIFKHCEQLPVILKQTHTSTAFLLPAYK